jgi:hypothetical protein
MTHRLVTRLIAGSVFGAALSLSCGDDEEVPSGSGGTVSASTGGRNTGGTSPQAGQPTGGLATGAAAGGSSGGTGALGGASGSGADGGTAGGSGAGGAGGRLECETVVYRGSEWRYQSLEEFCEERGCPESIAEAEELDARCADPEEDFNQLRRVGCGYHSVETGSLYSLEYVFDEAGELVGASYADDIVAEHACDEFSSSIAAGTLPGEQCESEVVCSLCGTTPLCEADGAGGAGDGGAGGGRPDGGGAGESGASGGGAGGGGAGGSAED